MSKYDPRSRFNSTAGMRVKVAVLDEVLTMVENLPDDANITEELLRNRNKLAEAIDDRTDAGEQETQFEVPTGLEDELTTALHRYARNLPRAGNRVEKRTVNLLAEQVKDGDHPTYRFTVPTDETPTLLSAVQGESEREVQQILQTQMRRRRTP